MIDGGGLPQPVLLLMTFHLLQGGLLWLEFPPLFGRLPRVAQKKKGTTSGEVHLGPSLWSCPHFPNLMSGP